VRSGDFLADAKIAWRDAYELHLFRLRLNLD